MTGCWGIARAGPGTSSIVSRSLWPLFAGPGSYRQRAWSLKGRLPWSASVARASSPSVASRFCLPVVPPARATAGRGASREGTQIAKIKGI